MGVRGGGGACGGEGFLGGVGWVGGWRGVGVFRLQVRPYAGIEQRRVAQHLLPVVVLQPGIVVREGDTMECALERTSGRDGWLLDRTLRRNCRAPCRWAFQSPCRVPSRRRPARAWPQPSSAWCAAACAFPRPWCPTSRRGCGRPSRCRNV